MSLLDAIATIIMATASIFGIVKGVYWVASKVGQQNREIPTVEEEKRVQGEESMSREGEDDSLPTVQMRSVRPPSPWDTGVLIDAQGRRVKPDRLSHRFKDMVRGAKLENRERLKLHSLRHSCGAWLASQGVSERIIQEILGHSSIQTTQIYSHIASHAMEDAMERAFGE